MNNITETLCEFAQLLEYQDLFEETVVQTKRFIADYFAASLAGIRVNRTFNSALMNVMEMLGGKAQSSVLLQKSKFSVTSAAYINAAYSHGADLDDGNRISAGHIGTHVISAVFALAEETKTSWKNVFTAINVGYEFFNRIGGAAQPSLYKKGFHSTGVVGAIAAAAASAKVLGLDKTGIYNSVSLAAVQAGGLIIIDESGQGCKPINAANAAKIGVTSALLAERKIEAPSNPLESKKGWFHAFTDGPEIQNITNELGQVFTINQSYLKLYPTCRHTHSCIDAILEIRKSLFKIQNYSSAMINKIQVFTYPNAIKSAGNILFPVNSEEAKFSISFAVAVALIKGRFTLDDLSMGLFDEEIHTTAKLVHLIPDASMENRNKGIRGAKICVHLKDGTCFEKVITTPKGEGADSLTWDLLEQKIINCADTLVSHEAAIALLNACKTINENNIFIYPALKLI